MPLGHPDTIRSNNKDFQHVEKQIDRRNFLQRSSLGIGALALGSLLNAEEAWSSTAHSGNIATNNFTRNNLVLPHYVQKAKRIIYLFQSGGPSQLDLFDYKPNLAGSIKI